jgi:hypothetical protein
LISTAADGIQQLNKITTRGLVQRDVPSRHSGAFGQPQVRRFSFTDVPIHLELNWILITGWEQTHPKKAEAYSFAQQYAKQQNGSVAA